MKYFITRLELLFYHLTIEEVRFYQSVTGRLHTIREATPVLNFHPRGVGVEPLTPGAPPG